MSVVDGSFDHPLKLEEGATMPSAGGIMNRGYQCGMLWGTTLAAGAQAYRVFGSGPQAKAGAIFAAQRLVESFRALNTSINCFELTGADLQNPGQAFGYFMKGGAIRCLRMSARYAPVAFSEINSALSESPIEAPSPPVSCASMLAQKMGVSDMHTVMAAGLAGGIGLSGAACGALGVAIWIIAMKHNKEGIGKIDYNSPIAAKVIDRFMQSTGSEFECSEIVGRRFENIDDHTEYLREGGCSKIIEVLAAHR